LFQEHGVVTAFCEAVCCGEVDALLTYSTDEITYTVTLSTQNS